MATDSWLFLRGWAREAGHWGGFPGEFARALSVAQPLCPDHAGTGLQRNTQAPLHAAGALESLRAVVPLRVGSKCFFLAHSFGAMLALQWAGTYPEQVAGMVLINPSLMGLSPWYRRLRPSALPTLLGALMDPDTTRRERRILGLISNNPPAQENVLPVWASIAQKRPMTRVNAIRQLIAAAGAQTPKLGGIPGLVLSGGGDRLVHPSCSEAIASHYGFDLERHPTAGHDLPLDAPEWIFEKILKWRQTLPSN